MQRSLKHGYGRGTTRVTRQESNRKIFSGGRGRAINSALLKVADIHLIKKIEIIVRRISV
jgi:hypothetical protein